ARVQVEEHDRCRWPPAKKHPFNEEQRGVGCKEDGNSPNGTKTREQPTRQLRGEYCEDGRTSHEIGKALNREVRQEQSVARRVRSDLLRDERRCGQRGDDLRPWLGHGTWLPI